MRVSAVVLCKDQAPNLNAIVSALALQTVRPDEVLVVDDRSAVQTHRVAAALGARWVSTGAHLLRGSDGARALARQLGADEARHSVLAYLDGDMIPARRYIEAGIDALRQAPLVKVWRRRHRADVRGVPDVEPRQNVGAGNDALPYWQFTSDAFVVCRGTAAALGGWDENFRGWGEEDVEFAYRFQRAGLRVVSASGPHVLATHIDHHVDARGNFQSLLANARYFLTKHPAIAAERSPYWRSLGVYEHAYRSPWLD